MVCMELNLECHPKPFDCGKLLPKPIEGYNLPSLMVNSVKNLNMKKYIIIAVVLITAGFIVFTSKEKTPDVSVDPTHIDFQEIVQTNGPVSAEVIVTNTGRAPLAINRLSTSCGCTTAKMDQTDLAAGESREMIIVFDPMAHPDESGPILRAVYLQTSDPDEPEIQIDITGVVTK